MPFQMHSRFGAQEIINARYPVIIDDIIRAVRSSHYGVDTRAAIERALAAAGFSDVWCNGFKWRFSRERTFASIIERATPDIVVADAGRFHAFYHYDAADVLLQIFIDPQLDVSKAGLRNVFEAMPAFPISAYVIESSHAHVASACA